MSEGQETEAEPGGNDENSRDSQPSGSVNVRGCDPFLLSKLMFVAGHVALKQLVHMEEIHKQKEAQTATHAKSKEGNTSPLLHNADPLHRS